MGQHLGKPSDRPMRYPLVLVEHPMEQGVSLPGHVEPAIRVALGLDILADESACNVVLLQHDALAQE